MSIEHHQTTPQTELDAYREALSWVSTIHPGATKEYVHINLTWEEWNRMRVLLGLIPQAYSKPKGIGGH